MSEFGIERNSLKTKQIKMGKRVLTALYLHEVIFADPKTHYRKRKDFLENIKKLNNQYPRNTSKK